MFIRTHRNRSADTSKIPAYGTVFRARDKRSSRIVALKSVRPDDTDDNNDDHDEDDSDDGISTSILREIGFLCRLRHPNIVELLDVAVAWPHESSPASQETARAFTGSGHERHEEFGIIMEFAENVSQISDLLQTSLSLFCRTFLCRFSHEIGLNAVTTTTQRAEAQAV